jgi:uncharacterized protein RhaS with RHS repeats
MYMQARYYDPVIGRFYSNDPVGFNNVHNFNRYAYANNNPYKYTDPDGNNPKLILDFAVNVALNYATTGQANLAGAASETIKGALNPLKTAKNIGKLAKALHGNSKKSMNAQHRYVIKDKEGNVLKTGISGGKLNKNGSSGRANSQLKNAPEGPLLMWLKKIFQEELRH